MIVGPVLLTLFIIYVIRIKFKPRDGFDHAAGYPWHDVEVSSPQSWQCDTCGKSSKSRKELV